MTYGTKDNPATAPAVDGGWGGILLSGLATAGGAMAGSDAMVAFGGGMAKSYAKSYDNFNKSLIEEQRTSRLQEAAMEREKNLAQFKYDMAADERALRQSNIEADRAFKEKKFEADQEYRSGVLGLQQKQEERLSKESGLRMQLTEAQLKEANKSVEQKAKEAYQAQQVVQDLQREASDAQFAKRLEEYKTSDNYNPAVEQKIIAARDFANLTGMDMATILNASSKKGSKVSAEVAQKVYTSALEEAKATEEYQDMKKAEGAAAADAMAGKKAGAALMQFNAMFGIISGGGGGGIAALANAGPGQAPPPGGMPSKEQLVSDLQQGKKTPDELRARAGDNEAQSAIVEEAIAAATSGPAAAPASGALQRTPGATMEMDPTEEAMQEPNLLYNPDMPVRAQILPASEREEMKRRRGWRNPIPSAGEAL